MLITTYIILAIIPRSLAFARTSVPRHYLFMLVRLLKSKKIRRSKYLREEIEDIFIHKLNYKLIVN